MKKHSLIIFCLFVIICIKAYSQTDDFNTDDFKKKYPIELYFIPVGVTDINHSVEIEKVLLNNADIGFCKIYKNEKSKIFAVKEINIESIKETLKELNISISNDFIYIIDNYFLGGTDPDWKPKSFPQMIKTGNSIEDEKRFANDVNRWKLLYKAEYEKMLENRKNNN